MIRPIAFLLGPFFDGTNEIVRLDSSDALYVDAYHTNARILLTGQHTYKIKSFRFSNIKKYYIFS